LHNKVDIKKMLATLKHQKERYY